MTQKEKTAIFVAVIGAAAVVIAAFLGKTKPSSNEPQAGGDIQSEQSTA